MAKGTPDSSGDLGRQDNDVEKKILISSEELPYDVRKLIADKKAAAELKELSHKDVLEKAKSEAEAGFEDYALRYYSDGELIDLLETDTRNKLRGDYLFLGSGYNYKSKESKSPKQYANDQAEAYLSTDSSSERENAVNRF